jgi:ATP-dependent Clp endopeptidase proteolytic subunit ClpP
MPHRNQLPEAGERRWYRIAAKKGEVTEVFIYDEIGRGFFGGGIAAEDFVKDLKALKLEAGDELKVRINSPGGNVFEGMAIHNYLRTLKSRVTVVVDGVAASIASLIAMAGDRIEMPENAMMFVHNPMMIAIGNAADMRKSAEDLDSIRDSMASSYLRKAGDKLDRKELYAMLDEETWLSASDAVAKGLADVVAEPVRAAALAQFDLAKYGFKVPAAIAAAKQDHEEDRRRRREQLQLLKT